MEDLEKRVFSFLEKDTELWTRGCIVTGRDGSLVGVVKDDSEVKVPYSGSLEYNYSQYDNSFAISCISNNYKVSSSLKKYKSNAARKKGLLTLFSTFQNISEMIGVTKLTINTWIIPARPQLLSDPSSFFYGWKPESKKYHKSAVEDNKDVKRLRDQLSLGSLSGYYKKLKVDKDKRKFKIPKPKKYKTPEPTSPFAPDEESHQADTSESKGEVVAC